MTQSIQFSLALFSMLFIGTFASELDLGKTGLPGLFLDQVIAQSDEEEEEPEDPRPERKPKTLTIEFFEQMERFVKVYEEEEDVAKGREILDRMIERSRRWNNAELAVLHQRYARMGFDLDDIDLVVEHLLKLLEFREDIIYGVEEMTLFQLAQINANEYEDFDTALDYIQQWLDLKLDWEEDGRSYAFIANLYARKEVWEQTIHWMKRAIQKEEEEGDEIDENWWRVLLQAHLTLSDEAGAGTESQIEHLEDALDLTQFLVLEYIEDVEYWNFLSGVYVRLASALQDSPDDHQEEADQLSQYGGFTLEGAYFLDLLTKETEYVRLVRGIANQGAFTRAAWIYQEGFDLEIIEQNFENLKRYGEYLQRSRAIEQAVAAYEAAVEIEEDANVLYLIATIYQSLDNYPKCVSFTEQAIRSTEGELKQPHQVKFLKGLCQFMDGQLGAAEETYRQLKEDIGENPEAARLKRLQTSIASYEKFIENERGRIQYENEVEESWREYNEEKANAN